MTTKKGLNLQQLFDDAQSTGVIGSNSSQLLSGDLGPMVIAGAAGKAMEEIVATDVTLVTVLLDSSSSIGYNNLEQSVRDGYNLLLDTFMTAREMDSLMVALWTFDDAPRVVHSYLPIAEAARLDKSNYRAGGWTSLYDTWCDSLAANLAYAQQLKASGTPCRSIVVVITDGEDTRSKKIVDQCKSLTKDLLRTEEFVFAFVGVGDVVDFREIAQQMGVPDNSIAVQTNATPDRLRQMFQLVSRSAIRVSRSLVTTDPGGFFH